MNDHSITAGAWAAFIDLSFVAMLVTTVGFVVYAMSGTPGL